MGKWQMAIRYTFPSPVLQAKAKLYIIGVKCEDSMPNQQSKRDPKYMNKQHRILMVIAYHESPTHPRASGRIES